MAVCFETAHTYIWCGCRCPPTPAPADGTACVVLVLRPWHCCCTCSVVRGFEALLNRRRGTAGSTGGPGSAGGRGRDLQLSARSSGSGSYSPMARGGAELPFAAVTAQAPATGEDAAGAAPSNATPAFGSRKSEVCPQHRQELTVGIGRQAHLRPIQLEVHMPKA